MHLRSKHTLLKIPAILLVAGSIYFPAIARSEAGEMESPLPVNSPSSSAVAPRDLAEIFTPYLEQISNSLPEGLVIRLPGQQYLQQALDGDVSQYKVQVTSSDTSLTINLYTCEGLLESCLVGSFSVESKASVTAQQAFGEHLQLIAPVTLDSNIRGYFLDGSRQQPQSKFSSVMWEQDGFFYTVKLLGHKRQELLYLAYSMANTEPIRNTITAATIPSYVE
ncbi:MAG: hypothetical protein F6K24_14765, partial [Okeania sp. SIO2D1]|nr:hypothetical protein [Okeania sp. SIO2D1]